MPSNWIQHVKQYAANNGVSYKDAMKLSKPSYNSAKGGDMKTTLRKAKNTTKRIAKVAGKASKAASKLLDKNAHFVDYIDSDLGKNLADISTGMKAVGSVSDRAVGAMGGKVSVKNVARKAKNTLKKAAKVSAAIAPLVAMSPELAPVYGAVNSGLALGSKAMGGSFKTTGGCINCVHCGGSIGFGRSESSIISDTHNSFAPLKPKSLKDRQHNN